MKPGEERSEQSSDVKSAEKCRTCCSLTSGMPSKKGISRSCTRIDDGWFSRLTRTCQPGDMRQVRLHCCTAGGLRNRLDARTSGLFLTNSWKFSADIDRITAQGMTPRQHE